LGEEGEGGKIMNGDESSLQSGIGPHLKLSIVNKEASKAEWWGGGGWRGEVDEQRGGFVVGACDVYMYFNPVGYYASYLYYVLVKINKKLNK
jgi:hypothetical protein